MMQARQMMGSVCALTLAATCTLTASAQAPLAAGAAAVAVAPARIRPAGCLPAHDGYLRAHLRGASDLNIDWHDRGMQCDGDVRPGGHAIRLTFAGRVQPGNHHVRFVFGIDAAPLAGVSHNVPAGVTVIFEGERRLYSTRGTAECTVDDLHQQSIGAVTHRLRVSARGFCIGAAARIGGGGDALLLTTFDFAGRISNPGPPSPGRPVD